MGLEVEYRVMYEMVGIKGEVVGGEYVTIDSLSAFDASVMKEELGDVVMSGRMLDEILAEEIIREYITGLVGAECLSERSFVDNLKRVVDATYRFGNINIALGDPAARILNDKKEITL